MACVGSWARATVVIFLLASPIEITAQTNTSWSGNVSVASGNASVTGTKGEDAPRTGGAAVSETASIIAAAGHVLVLCVVAAVLGALALATYHLVQRFIVALDQHREIGTRGRWGGFGGSDTGWELTPALATLIAALVLAAVTAALGSALVSVTAKQFDRSPPAATPATAAKTPK
jgi:hypothetical protein